VNPVPRRLADVSQARRLLGFEAQVPLEVGLTRLVAWWREMKAQELPAREPRRGGIQ